MIFRSPLEWPAGVARARVQQPSPFSKNPDKIRQALEGEVGRLGASSPVLSCNLKMRQDGRPYATDRGLVHDPGVALYFAYRGKQHCMACDRYEAVYDNMHALALTIEALRGIERWGSSEMQARTFQGFGALPPPEEPWHEILQVRADSPLEVAEAAYKALAKRAHPDAGGDPALMGKLNRAIQAARARTS